MTIGQLNNIKGSHKPEDAAALDIIKLCWYLWVLNTGIENIRMCFKVLEQLLRVGKWWSLQLL